MRRQLWGKMNGEKTAEKARRLTCCTIVSGTLEKSIGCAKSSGVRLCVPAAANAGEISVPRLSTV